MPVLGGIDMHCHLLQHPEDIVPVAEWHKDEEIAAAVDVSVN